jgi:hypothetical protein
MKRKYDQTNTKATPTVPSDASSANAQPLGLKGTHQYIPDEEATPNNSVMMASLRNKNKKRGFKNSMASPLPLKIVFGNATDNTPALNTEDALPFVAAEHDFEFTSAPRLIPPSEKQDKGLLPANMFVTSVDVEEGVWQKKKGKKVKLEAVTEQNWLDYGRDEEVEDASNAVDEVDFNAAEAGWESFASVTSIDQLYIGRTVGWKVRPCSYMKRRFDLYLSIPCRLSH